MINWFTSRQLTRLHHTSLCAAILEAYGWDVDAAVSSMADGEFADRFSVAADAAASSDAAFVSQWNPTTDADSGPSSRNDFSREHWHAQPSGSQGLGNATERDETVIPASSGLVWKIVALPLSMVRGSYDLMYGAVGLGMWIAGGILSQSLGMLGWAAGDGLAGVRARDQAATPLLAVSAGAAEALSFVRNFEREYGEYHPAFQTFSFVDTLRLAKDEFKFLFLYLHSPDHENTPIFCEQTLCSDLVVQFVNEHFVSWGGNVRATEGFKMSNSLKASTFPFCAVVMPSSNQRIALLQQVEGPRSAEELVTSLQKVVDEHGTVLVAARIVEEERRVSRHLREEQDAAYQAALQADQEREHQRQEEEERKARDAAEAGRRQKEEEETAAQAARDAAEKEAALERRRQEKAMALKAEPEKGPNVTEVLVRFPNGERKERRFHCTSTISSVYDYVGSLHFFDAVRYKLVSNFPRVVYGPDKLGLSLKDAGLHPCASLYVQVEDA